MGRVAHKGYTLIRDNSIMYVLNKYGCISLANMFNWATTETSDIVVLLVINKLGVTSIEAKYLALLIVAFIL
jgi:hypothetical protein